MIKLSDAELAVMKVLWEAQPQDLPLSTAEVIRRVKHRQWSDNTVKTLLSRMQKKGAVSCSQGEGRNYYGPFIPQDDYVAQESTSFISKMMDGMSFPLLANFLSRTELKAGEIEELKRILEEKTR